METMRFNYLYIVVALLITAGVVSAQDIDVRLSIKYILDSNGIRPQGMCSTDENIQYIIDRSNVVLERWNRGYQFIIKEIKDISGATRYFHLCEDVNDTNDPEYYGLEDEAEANPGKFFWRTDAINIFIVKTWKRGNGAAAAIPSAPHDFGYELVVTSVDRELDLTFLHELGHHNDLGHTFEEDDKVDDTRQDVNPLQCKAQFECDMGGKEDCCCELKLMLLSAAAIMGGWTQQEYDDIRWNLMSYYGAPDCDPNLDFSNVRLTEGQLDRWTDTTRHHHFWETSGFTRFVDYKNDSPPFDGNSVNPFPTVADGIAAAYPDGGDIVLIRTGTYNETWTENKPVTLRANRGPVIIGQ